MLLGLLGFNRVIRVTRSVALIMLLGIVGIMKECPLLRLRVIRVTTVYACWKCEGVHTHAHAGTRTLELLRYARVTRVARTTNVCEVAMNLGLRDKAILIILIALRNCNNPNSSKKP